jgi:hypothetical protein
MASEMFRRDKMNTARSEYVGALFEDERRLVLVPVSEDEPWEAFRQMRRVMRRERKDASIGLFASPNPIERTADVIDLSSRRRAG